MWNFLQGTFYSLLPKPYWRGWNPDSTVTLERSAILSGVVEFVLCAWLLARNYLDFLVVRQRQLSPVASANSGTQMYFSGVVTLEYLLRPLSVVLLFFALEGAVRAMSAFVTDDILPSFPARLACLLQANLNKRHQEKSMGPAVPDHVEWLQDPDYAVRISCSRPKEGWRNAVTVAINDELYDLATMETGEAPRAFVYLLRKQPAEKIIRGLYRYESDTH